LNVVVLDACRDNPFSWRRSGSRGLTLVSNQPADSIIVYATSAGSTAADGTGRNGLFTEQLLKNLKTPGLEVNDVFRLTMGDVARASNNQQRPAIYNQFPGTAYFGAPPSVFDQGSINIATGSLEISTITAGSLEIRGGTINQKADLPAWGTLPISRINAGTYEVTMRYGDGKVEQRSVEIGRSESKKLEFTYRVALQPAPAVVVPETVATGTLSVTSMEPGKVQIPTASGIQEFYITQTVPLTMPNLAPGNYQVKIIYNDGKTEEEAINIEGNKTAAANFIYRPAPPPAAPPATPVWTNHVINPSAGWHAWVDLPHNLPELM